MKVLYTKICHKDLEYFSSNHKKNDLKFFFFKFYDFLTKMSASKISEDILELLDDWDENDKNPERHLNLIKERKMDAYTATYVFAAYMNYNNLTVETVKKFISLDVDINQMNKGYWTDDHDDNAFSTAAEYRRVEDMKVLLECGANIFTKENIILHFIAGHSALYTIVPSQEDLDLIVEGVEILLNAGAKISQDDIDFVHEEFVENEFKDIFEQFLEETYSAQNSE